MTRRGAYIVGMTGKELRALRKSAGLTQRQLSSRVDVDTGTISRWERGVMDISVPASLALRAILAPASLLDTGGPEA